MNCTHIVAVVIRLLSITFPYPSTYSRLFLWRIICIMLSAFGVSFASLKCNIHSPVVPENDSF
jgi:hypothetical protein